MEENKNNKELDTSSKENEQIEQNEEPIYESNAQRRLRLLGVENDTKIHDESKEITKGSFWANLWYKRKWTIIISAFFIIMAIILLFSIIFKERTDLSVGYIGPGADKASAIKEVFEPYVKDTDNDGKKELSFSATEHYSREQLGTNATTSAEQANDTAAYSFLDDIRYNNFTVVFIDKSLYDLYENHFYTIDQLIELGAEIDKDKHSAIFRDGAEYYECGIVLKHTKLYYDNRGKLSSIPHSGDIIVCFSKTKIMGNASNSEQIEFLNSILEYENKH